MSARCASGVVRRFRSPEVLLPGARLIAGQTDGTRSSVGNIHGPRDLKVDAEGGDSAKGSVTACWWLGLRCSGIANPEREARGAVGSLEGAITFVQGLRG